MYNTITPNTSGGCRDLVNYLEKENSLSGQFADYLDKENRTEQDHFFNGDRQLIDKEEVISGIDHNCKGLKRDESRFFSMTINPSAKEIKHLESLADAQIMKMHQLGIGQVLPGNDAQIREALVKDMLKQYAVQSMDQYAQNFGREGIKDNRDLVWFGRVEKDRYWKYSAAEVKHNKKITTQLRKLEQQPGSTARDRQIKELQSKYILESQVRKDGKAIPITEMMPKSGQNYHVHIVVSRRDREQRVSLSPLAKARSNDKHKINGKECKIGFNRDNYTQSLETAYDRSFSYQREYYETYEGRKMMKENPELYKAAEATYNAEHFPERQNNIEQKAKAQAMAIGNDMAQKAGLNYIRAEIKPYKETINTGYKGVKLLIASKKQAQRAASLGKAAAFSFAKGTGMVTGVANPALLAVQLGTRAVTAAAKGFSVGY